MALKVTDRHTRLHPFLRSLERIRRRIPYAYWLVYDGVVVVALLWGGPVRIVAFACIGIAVFFDVVEFIVKGMEDRWVRRLFEGTGAPS